MLLSKEDIAEMLERSYESGDMDLAGKLLETVLPFTSHAEVLAFSDCTIIHLTQQNEFLLQIEVPITWDDSIPDFKKVVTDLKEWKFSDGVLLFNHVRVTVAMTLYSEDMERE